MKIPDDIYYRVLDLATALVRASESFDKTAHEQHYSELRGLVDGEAAAGNPHPFLFETLADFTDEDGAALNLYQRALDCAARADATAYRASIQFAMAERYKSMGEASRAHDYACRAGEAAKLVDDLELQAQISEFLRNEADRP